MERSNLDRPVFEVEVGGKTVEIFPSKAPNRPVVYLNTVSNEGLRVYQTLQGMGCPDFTLVAIGNLDWNHDMAPWDIPPISKGDTPCTMDATFQLNPGNHFKNAVQRTAAGIAWILNK